MISGKKNQIKIYTYLIRNTQPFQHGLKLTRHCLASVRLHIHKSEDQLMRTETYLWDLNNIQQKTQWISFVFQVNSPRHKRMMVWGCPGIGCKVQLAWVILKIAYENKIDKDKNLACT
jgi:hypothetical protein